MSDMQCMLQVSPERLLMAGHQDKMLDFNLSHCKEQELVSNNQSKFEYYAKYHSFAYIKIYLFHLYFFAIYR